MRTSDPHGGAIAVFRWYCPLTKSYDTPYDERSDVRPSPAGSQATPTRGAKSVQRLFMPA